MDNCFHCLRIINAFCVVFFQQVKAIVESGCKVAVTGGKVGELYLHYCNKYGLMIVRVPSKFDIRRLCKSIGATALPRLVNSFFPGEKKLTIIMVIEC